MESFNPETDSVLLQKWYIDLVGDSTEFKLLFAKPLRNLAALASHITNPANRFFYEADGKGIWLAVWLTPFLTNGIEFGAWIRKDKRGTRQALRAIDEAYEQTLEKFPTLIGITRQYPKLHELHLKLGYELVGEFPGVFDGETVWMYRMTRESRVARGQVAEVLAGLRRAKRDEHEQRQVVRVEQPVESIRTDSGVVRHLGPQGGTASLGRAVESGRRSIKDWWYNKPNSDHEPAH